MACPSTRVGGFHLRVELVASSQDSSILSRVALSRAHVTDTAVTMIVVIPTRKIPSPLTRVLDCRKAFSRELRSIFDCAEQRLDECIRVGHQLHLVPTVK